MRKTLRPYATAGVAIVGAGIITVTPVAAPLSDVQVRDVTLTAGDTLPDLLAPWIDQFNTASENATTLVDNFSLAPGVGLQQLLANMSGYLQDFFDDPTSNTVTSIMGQIQDNLAGVLTGYGLSGAGADTISTVTQHTLDGPGTLADLGHIGLFNELPSFLPSGIDPATVTPIVDFLASPLSGIIIGELGPYLSPWVALMNSISDGDDFNTTLANMVGAFFNGADVNLDSLIPAIEQAGIFPPGMNVANLDFALGGLLSPGSVAVGPYEFADTSTPAVGGSIFNSVGISLTNVPVLGNIVLNSQPIGPLAAMEAWGQTIGALLGSGWDGKGAVDVSPPLLGIDLPTIPDDFLDDGGATAAAATDSLSWLQDLIAAL